MQYNSPFHLLPKRDLSALTNDELKRWKRELLLQFDLQQSTTININEKEYDKNSIIQAFDNLKDRPEYHWRLYQNKPLLDFVEGGFINFFDHKKNWADFEDISYRDWLEQWFISEYDDMVFEMTEVEDSCTKDMLQTLETSDFQLPQEWKYKAFTKTNRFFKRLIEKGTVALNDGFIVKGKKVKLSSEVHQYINLYYLNVLDILPDNGIRQSYADFSNRVILKVFSEERYIEHIDKESLQTVENAAEINAAVNNDAFSKELLNQIKDFRSRRNKQTARIIFVMVKLIVMLLLRRK